MNCFLIADFYTEKVFAPFSFHKNKTLNINPLFSSAFSGPRFPSCLRVLQPTFILHSQPVDLFGKIPFLVLKSSNQADLPYFYSCHFFFTSITSSFPFTLSISVTVLFLFLYHFLSHFAHVSSQFHFVVNLGREE
jgi:hypothetical protein